VSVKFAEDLGRNCIPVNVTLFSNVAESTINSTIMYVDMCECISLYVICIYTSNAVFQGKLSTWIFRISEIVFTVKSHAPVDKVRLI
jgi:hypothetical protein